MAKTKNKLLAAFIAAIITITAVMFIVPHVTASAEAQNEIAATDGLNDAAEVNKLDEAAQTSMFDGGTGSKTDPYLISTSEQLVYLAQEINNDNYNGTCFKLTANINLGGIAWTPIASGDSSFTGTFDGAGYTISNLNPTANNGYLGLFGSNCGTIKNIYLNSVNVVYTEGDGAVALCSENTGTIESCAVLSGIIDASHPGNASGKAAGICIENHGKINKCYNMAYVKSDTNGAGIVLDNSSEGTVSNCYNAGEVSGTSITVGNLGGICSQNYGKIKYCLNYGAVKNANTVGAICASFYYGQSTLTGETSSISSCYSDINICNAEIVGKHYAGIISGAGTFDTVKFCGSNYMTNDQFGSEWALGSVVQKDTDSPKRKTAEYTYPSLNGVTKSVLRVTGDIYNFGTDTENWLSVTVINDADGLKAISENLGGNYVLGGDIGLKDAEWTPIGSESNPFTGKFSGDGHTISNFKSSVSKPHLSAGLFGYNSGTIQNVYVDNFEVKTNGNSPAAGLCGTNNASGVIEGCATLGGSVSAVNSGGGAGGVGGICANNSGTINRCYNMAAVKTGQDGGGVVNANREGGIVSNCYNVGEVSSEGESGTVIGGISALNWGKIEHCLNYGNVNNAITVGGICGQNDDGKGTISSCYSDSTVCSAGAVGNYSNNLTNVGTKTTEELCTYELLNDNGFGSEWVGGTYDIGPSRSDPTIRFGEFTIIYPFLNGVGEKYMIKGEAYNFKTDGADDWQRYTLITTAEGLAAINENLDGNYVLGKDIDLKDAEWTPIGSAMGGAFSGKFSGDGHTIERVKVNVTTDENEYAGLFGCSTGVIMNLAVEGDISGTSCVGGICGGNDGTIYACSFNGTVKGTGSNIGGICGYNFKSIKNCFSNADVKGGDEVGGICGYNDSSATVSNTISVCTVSGSGNLVAAVCGKNDGTLKDNYFDTTVCSLVGAKDNTGNERASGTFGKPTKELCDETRMQDALDTNMWNLGNITFTYDVSNERKRTVTYTYPSLKDVAGSVYSVDVKEYNFSTGDNPDWQPYTEISTAEKFIALGNDSSKWSGSYVLTENIDLSNKTVNPIGNDIILAFTGNFSGDGHTISGVKINSTGDNVGLFGFAGDSSGNSTTIMNLAVEGDIVGKYNVGGICGYGYEKVNIFACSFKGSVSGKDCVGGICGVIYRSCYIENCFNSGTIEATGEATGDVGGLLGYVSDGGHVNNSINVGKVTGKNFGPICGDVGNTLSVNNNYYDSKTFSGTDSYGTPKTTAELCDKDALTALNLKDSIWQAGEITRTTDAENKRMSVVNAKYLSLNGVGEPLSLDGEKQYNFKTTGDDDEWQTYTEIKSPDDLNKIKDNLGGNYVLMKDIPLGDFTPIGSQDAPFTGKFSGNGHKITAKNAGIFGYNSGTIMNLAVEGNIVGTNNVGSICGYNNGMIYACSFNGSVKGAEYVGGISGYNSSNGTITNCYAIGSVEATVDYAGGITSVNDGGMKINCCYFAGTAVAPNDYNAICNGGSPNCYYDRELFNINNYGRDALTTAELCDSNSLPYKFSGEIWETGEFSVNSTNSTDEKFRTVSFTYPRLKEGCAAYTVNDVKQYNFGMDGKDNWAQFNEINSLADLNNINKNHHTNYVLMTDIDLKEGTFSPISPNKSFWGNFSGNGNTIKNGTIGSGGDFTALFSSNGGLIMNLAVKCDVSGADIVGGICGENRGTIYGCSFEGKVTGNKYGVGGICGRMTGSYSHIINCYVIGSIEATDKAGGILGTSSASSSISDTPNIENCYFVGTVTVPDSGKKDAICSNQTDIIKNCYYNKDIYTGSTTNGTAKTTAEFYSGSLLTGFDDSVWEAGKTAETYDPDNERMRSQERFYPSLIGVGEPYFLGKVKQYNFGMDDNDDWQEYTEISKFEDFEKIYDNRDDNYVLMNDIILKDKLKTTSLVPIVAGKFSGDGHTISGVNIRFDNEPASLFSENFGTIMYLAVKGDVAAYSVGGICGTNYGTIYSCSFEGSVTGSEFVGGICAANAEHGKISSCYAIADIISKTDYACVGGIAGRANADFGGSISYDSLIENCYFAGTITGKLSEKVGVIYGRCELRDAPVINCYYNSDLCDKTNDDKVTGLSTSELCRHYPSRSFRPGYYTITPDSGNDRMRTLSYSYPRLVMGCAPYERKDIKQYNFKTDGNDDWQEYTAITSAADFAKINDNPDGSYVLMNDIGSGETIRILTLNGKFSGNGHTISSVNINTTSPNYAGLFGENNGLIMYLAVKGNINGSTNVGGICATNSGTIYGCSFDGSVTGSENVGGICGKNNANSFITNCFTNGTVTCTTNERTVGGVCGIIDNSVDSEGKISNCISICKIVGHGDAICGNSSSAIVDCYYNTEISSSTGGFGGTGMTTDELCVVDMGSEWENGSFSADVDSKNAKFRTAKAVYPKLKCFKNGYTKTMKQYNFGTNGTNDWQEYSEITSEAEFIALGNDKSKWDNNYVLTADIDLRGKTVKPIGELYNEFTGKFSGDGHTISNVTITGENCVGLFGYSTSKIVNLAVVNGNISGTEGNVGGICGYLDNGSIINCSFEGSVKGGRYVGGICGYDWAGTISNCYAIADIEADGTDEFFKNNNEEYAGGICGLIKGFTSYNGQVINNCYFVGTVKGDGNGAILGMEITGGNAGIANCYYNKDLYTEASGNGTGLTTFEMTSSDVLTKMSGFDTKTWEKKANDKIRKFAYYPSLSTNHAPYVKYSTELEFTKVGTETPIYGDEIEFNVKVILKLDGKLMPEDTAGEFLIKVGNEIVVSSSEIVNNKATYTAKKGGNTKFTLVYKNGNPDFFSEEIAKNLTVNIEKLTLSVDNFEFTPPTDTVFSGKAKAATVAVRSETEGVGAVTVKYYMNGVETEPVDAGTYTVKIDVAEGDIYKSARGLTSEDWTFTIEKATASAVKVNTDSVPWNKNGVHKLTITGLPENHGGFISGKATLTKNKGNIVGSLIPFSDGVLTYTVNKLSAANLGDTATIEVEIETKNYTTFSVTVEITIVKMTLTAPKNVQVKSGDGKQKITWSAVENAEYYRVQRLDGNVWRTVSQTRNLGCHIAGVSSGKTYSYRVLACDSTTYGPASAAVSATYAGVPKNLKAAASNKSLTLTWDKVSGASGYRVQQLKNNVWSTLALPTATTYTVNNLTNGTRYSFRVLANVNDVWSAASTVITAVPDLIVTNVAAEAGSKSVTLTWTSPINAQIYRVQRLEANTWTTIGYANTTRYTDTNVVSGKSYSYRILAFDGKRWCSASETATVDFN